MIKKGETFLCIKDVIMQPSEKVTYKKDQTYVSENDYCITNDFDNKFHEWTSENEFNLHFEKYVEKKGLKNDQTKLPYYIVLFKQFPLALKEVMKCSAAGNKKYHKGDKDWQNFSRVENADVRYKNAMLRHIGETGQIEDMIEYGEISHEGAVVWNALADLEVKLRKENK